MVQAGSRVVFVAEGPYIMNLLNGRVTGLEERKGAYVFDMWVPKGSDNSWDNIGHKNLFKVIEEEEQSFLKTLSQGLGKLEKLKGADRIRIHQKGPVRRLHQQQRRHQRSRCSPRGAKRDREKKKHKMYENTQTSKPCCKYQSQKGHTFSSRN